MPEQPAPMIRTRLRFVLGEEPLAALPWPLTPLAFTPLALALPLVGRVLVGEEDMVAIGTRCRCSDEEGRDREWRTPILIELDVQGPVWMSQLR